MCIRDSPIDVKFGPDGAMYIVDYGIANVNAARAAEGQVPYEFPPETGAVWRVTPRDAAASSDQEGGGATASISKAVAVTESRRWVALGH